MGIKILTPRERFDCLPRGQKKWSRRAVDLYQTPPQHGESLNTISKDWTGDIFDNLESWHKTLRRTDSSDDSALLKAVMTRAKIRVKPHEFFDTN